MRFIGTFILLLAAAFLFCGVPAQAETLYPWCSQIAMGDGVTSCGFETIEQCRAATAGSAGTCVRNLWYDQQQQQQQRQYQQPAMAPPPRR
jgi:hypothetical protein